MRLYGWVFGAVFGIFAVSATFCQVFSGFLAGFAGAFLRFMSIISYRILVAKRSDS